MIAGGHTPNIEKVMEASYCDPAKENCERYRQQLLEQQIFEKASIGKIITSEDIKQFNSAGPLQWINANNFDGEI
jgi:hypothetical protein